MMYALYRVTVDHYVDWDLICVSKDADKLVHYYNCMDRDETAGKKLWELQVGKDPDKMRNYLNFRELKKAHFVIDEVEEV